MRHTIKLNYVGIVRTHGTNRTRGVVRLPGILSCKTSKNEHRSADSMRTDSKNQKKSEEILSRGCA